MRRSAKVVLRSSFSSITRFLHLRVSQSSYLLISSIVFQFCRPPISQNLIFRFPF
ncbi:hypothetical protein Syun_021703 [Stephania yunnanensis]|uniref:Uncharacterized protein n=1 Tax=Stephania yunnanensis TaxID=152371 RepID=A0AAP0IG44_9MAGN